MEDKWGGMRKHLQKQRFSGKHFQKALSQQKNYPICDQHISYISETEKRGTWQTKQVSRTETFILNHTPKYQVFVNFYELKVSIT